MARQKVKVKVENRHIATVLVVVVAAVVGYVLYTSFLPGNGVQTNDYVIDYNGAPLAFRADPVEADKVNVVPSETDVQKQIFKPPRVEGPNGEIIIRSPLKNVTIVFKAQGVSDGTLGWYTVEVTEIIKKLTLLYKGRYNVDIKFNIAETDDYSALRGTNLAPVVALVHPDIADGTFVSVDADTNVITVSGGDSLKDFDLATVKFMMIALGIDVDQGAV